MVLFAESSPSYKWWLLGVVMLGTFLAVMDSTVVNVGLPVIMHTYGGEIGMVQWIVSGYMLSMVLMLPTSGYLAERFGYKRMYIVGLAIFTIGSAICSMAPNLYTLIGARIFQGLGCGIIQPLGMAIVSRVFPPEQRGLALGFWAVAVAASVSIGPFAGGYMVDNFNWHYIFYINIPLGVLCILGVIFIQREYRAQVSKAFDLRGFVLMLLWLPIAQFALSEASSPTNLQGWGSPWVWGSGLVSVLFFVWFVVRGRRLGELSLVDLRLFSNRNFTLGMVVMLFFGLGLFGGNYLLPLYLQHVLGYSAFAAGAVFLPVGIIQGALAPMSGYLGKFTGNRILILGGTLILASYFFLSGTFAEHTPHWVIMLSVYLRGVGMGLSFTPLNAFILKAVESSQISQASGIANTIRQFSGSLGIAIFTSVITLGVANYSHPHNPDLEANLKSYAMKGVETDRVTIALMVAQKEAYTEGIRDNFRVAGVMTLLALVPLIMIRRKRDSRH